MAKVEQPLFILPKKRNGRKPNTISSHVDHIITVQGVQAAECDLPVKYKPGLPSPTTEHVATGIIHSTMEGLKSNMKINLPIITDVHDETMDVFENDPQKKQSPLKDYQPLPNFNGSREIIDLSPILENLSETGSSHDNFKASLENVLKSGRILNSDHNENSSTPNSMSQTQSENSFEMGTLDSLKNSAKRKKRVNIAPEAIERDDTEITALNIESEGSLSPDCTIDSKDRYLTMVGTIKRGKKKGQNVDVQLNISREELELIEAAIVAEEYNKMDISKCSVISGPHIFLFTLLCSPIVAFVSALYCFYIGTLTWYNIFNHIADHMSLLKKLLLTPIVILSYPFLIVTFTVVLSLYAGFIQLTFSGRNWWKVVCDFEKGFYGWLCNRLELSECSPYEVIILTDVKPA